MRIGLIGYGGVGKAFIQLIVEKSAMLKEQGLSFDVVYIMGSKRGLYNPNGLNCTRLLADSNDGKSIEIDNTEENRNITPELLLQNKDIDLLVELTSTNKETGEPAKSYILKALQNKIHVVTGNKGPIVHGYRELSQAAREKGVKLGIGCTCGGALPSVNGGTIDMAGSEVYSIEGVLNGTTNYILNEMEETGCTYETALEKAKACGIAEANPSFDVDGWDTAFKLLILTNVVMNENKTLADIKMQGIANLTPKDIQIAKAEGKRYKLIGRAKREGKELQLVVAPEKLSEEHPFYRVDGKNKAVKYESDTLGDLTLIGGASGTTAAAASILRDIVSIYSC